MRASLDTNIIIHLYRAECEWILFDEFSDGIYMYEQIINIELRRHGQEIIEKVEDDIKQGGPYMSLLQFIDNDILPFDFTDISLLGWKFESHMGRFIRRFWSDPFQENEKEWMRALCRRHNVNAKIKMIELQKALQIHYD